MRNFSSDVQLPAICIVLCLIGLFFTPVHAQPSEGERHVLLIGGLGGNEQYSDTFRQYLYDTRQAFLDEFQVPEENITVLAEGGTEAGTFITDVSAAENIRRQFSRLSSTVNETDQVYILLFGHGSFSGQRARLNIPRRDLSDADFAQLVGSLEAERLIFINTASSSGPFIETLSGPDRIIITATRSGRQSNETMFPEFLIEAFTSPDADIDQDDRLSVREAFLYAAQKTSQWFSREGRIASEHALLEDTGDGQGVQGDELEQSAEGNLAAITYLHPPAAPRVASSGTGADSVEAVRAEKQELEKKIATLKSEKEQMPESEYYEQLEQLLLRLARISHPSDTADRTR